MSPGIRLVLVGNCHFIIEVFTRVVTQVFGPTFWLEIIDNRYNRFVVIVVLYRFLRTMCLLFDGS